MQTRETFTELQKNQYHRSKRVLVLLALSLTIAFIFSLSAGDVWFWPAQWAGDSAQLFVWQLRLPRSLAVMVVGASLAVAGAAMQTLFENPLAEPGLLGVANGAGVALVLTVLIGGSLLPMALISLSAILGALIMTCFLLSFTLRRRLSNARLLLVGMALGIICSAIMTWAVYFSSSLDLRQLMYWMMGGFGGVDWRQSGLLLLILPILLWLCGQGKTLNLMMLGEIQAKQLGLSLHRWRSLLVLAIGWLVGVSVALAGVVSFIGLVIPHMLRLSGLTDQRFLLPGCALAGASVLLIADVVARIVLVSAELPIGVVTATLGAPLFIWLLISTRN